MMVGRELREFFSKPDVPRGETLLEVGSVVTDRGPAPLSLDVARGEIVGLAGPVGAGRTELLETIAGARHRHGGQVRVGGATLPSGKASAALRAGVALVPEDRHSQGLVLISSISCNVSMGRFWKLWRSDPRAERERAEDAVDDLAIRCASVEALVSTLSGGNQQRVVVDRTLPNDPHVLLLDEPTHGVDIGARHEIYTRIGRGITFLLVTLGTASLFRGTGLVVTGGSTQTLFDYELIRTLGAGRIGGVPWPVIVALTSLVSRILVGERAHELCPTPTPPATTSTWSCAWSDAAPRTAAADTGAARMISRTNVCIDTANAGI